MKFKEVYGQLFAQIEPSQQLLAATRQLARQKARQPGGKRLPGLALAALCLLLLAMPAGLLLNAGQATELAAPQGLARSAEGPVAFKSAGIAADQEAAPYVLTNSGGLEASQNQSVTAYLDAAPEDKMEELIPEFIPEYDVTREDVLAANQADTGPNPRFIPRLALFSLALLWPLWP